MSGCPCWWPPLSTNQHVDCEICGAIWGTMDDPATERTRIFLGWDISTPWRVSPTIAGLRFYLQLLQLSPVRLGITRSWCNSLKMFICIEILFASFSVCSLRCMIGWYGYTVAAKDCVAKSGVQQLPTVSPFKQFVSLNRIDHRGTIDCAMDFREN